MKSRLVALCLVAAAPANAAYSDLYVFGDSLVDAGNIEIVAALGNQPDPSPAALGYFPGRFSNGPTFADRLNQRLFGTLSTPAFAGGNNYGFGGALATTSGDDIPDFAAQIGLFGLLNGPVADPDALYLINFGGNDGFAILNGAPLAPGAVGAALASGVAQLAALGARNFLVTNVVDLAVAPITDGFEPVASAVSIAVNAGIDDAFAALTLPGDARVFRFDAFALSRAFAADPGAYGLPGLDMTTVCIEIGAGPACPNLNFMDRVHPTAVVHDVFGDAIFQQVPAPAALALFGLALAPLAWRRR